ncbi:unnamed protein product [Amoebophrya sp. A25]|nr:unnamed protein product [Amoebophrya sp. A25]|eukprot:GSA25T00009604001.1
MRDAALLTYNNFYSSYASAGSARDYNNGLASVVDHGIHPQSVLGGVVEEMTENTTFLSNVMTTGVANVANLAAGMTNLAAGVVGGGTSTAAGVDPRNLPVGNGGVEVQVASSDDVRIRSAADQQDLQATGSSASKNSLSSPSPARGRSEASPSDRSDDAAQVDAAGVKGTPANRGQSETPPTVGGKTIGGGGPATAVDTACGSASRGKVASGAGIVRRPLPAGGIVGRGPAPDVPADRLLSTLYDFGRSDVPTAVVKVDSSADGRLLAAAGADGCLRVWNTAALEKDVSVRPVAETFLPFRPRCLKVLATTSTSKATAAVAGHAPIATLHALEQDCRVVSAVSLSGSTNHVAMTPASTSSSSAQMRNQSTATTTTQMNQDDVVTTAMDFLESTLDSTLLLATQRGGLHCWDIRMRGLAWSRQTIPPNLGVPSAISIGGLGKYVALATLGGALQLFDLRFLAPVRTWQLMSGAPVLDCKLLEPARNLFFAQAEKMPGRAAGYDQAFDGDAGGSFFNRIDPFSRSAEEETSEADANRRARRSTNYLNGGSPSSCILQSGSSGSSLECVCSLGNEVVVFDLIRGDCTQMFDTRSSTGSPVQLPTLIPADDRLVQLPGGSAATRTTSATTSSSSSTTAFLRKQCHDACARSLLVTACQSQVLFAGTDRKVRLWNLCPDDERLYASTGTGDQAFAPKPRTSSATAAGGRGGTTAGAMSKDPNIGGGAFLGKIVIGSTPVSGGSAAPGSDGGKGTTRPAQAHYSSNLLGGTVRVVQEAWSGDVEEPPDPNEEMARLLAGEEAYLDLDDEDEESQSGSGDRTSSSRAQKSTRSLYAAGNMLRPGPREAPGYHRDAILDMTFIRRWPPLLATAGRDGLVKLWG